MSSSLSSPRIRLLPPELADQIAAGEVVERPASVVKELVENALDAGARRIEVTLEGGGLKRIAVTDDGAGMTPDEAHLAIRRFATSKLRALDDLFSLSTMGFRGEALPSIASVSEFALTTRTQEAESGYRLEVSAGVAGQGRPVGAPVGTEVVVDRLLGNVPARLKFLKSQATETAHVTDTVVRLALAHPHLHFRLRTDGKTTLDLPPHGSSHERARVALSRGARSAAQLHPAVGEEHGVHVEASLGAPEEAVGTTRNTYTLVNRRFVRDRGLLTALGLGYGELLERGRYPLGVVHVTLPGRELDVNVHPQKLEVRFARSQEVYAAVRHVVARALAEAPWLATPPSGRAAMRVYSFPPLLGEAAHRPGYAEQRRRASDALRLFAAAPTLPGMGAPPAVPGGPVGRSAEPLRPLHFADAAAPDDVSFDLARGRGAPGSDEHPRQQRPLEAREGASSPEPDPASGGAVHGGLAARGAALLALAAGPGASWRADAVDPSPSGAPGGRSAPSLPVDSRGRLLTPPGPLPGTSTLALPSGTPSAAPPTPPAALRAGSSVAERRAAEPDGFFGRLTYLGQLDRTYLLCEAPGELVLIDQHAAHERVAFQRLRDAHAHRHVRSQRLLLPLTVELDDRLRAAAEDHLPLLQALGYGLELAPAGASLQSVPEGLGRSNPVDVLHELLGELDASDRAPSTADTQPGVALESRVMQERVDRILATIACHSVVRAGDTLSSTEVRALLESMDGIDYRAHCPHGRPVLLRISIHELERRFGRT